MNENGGVNNSIYVSQSLQIYKENIWKNVCVLIGDYLKIFGIDWNYLNFGLSRMRFLIVKVGILLSDNWKIHNNPFVWVLKPFYNYCTNKYIEGM